MKHVLKVLVGISILVVAASAHATIILESFGTWAPGGFLPGTAFTDTETVLVPPSTTAPYAPLTSNTTLFANFAPIGVAFYTGAVGQSLILDLTVTDVIYSPDNLTRSIDGFWIYGGGTGTYDPSLIAGGDGTFAISQTSATSPTFPFFSGEVLVGNLYATPEPGTYAVLGLGVVGLLVRRRRSR